MLLIDDRPPSVVSKTAMRLLLQVDYASIETLLYPTVAAYAPSIEPSER